MKEKYLPIGTVVLLKDATKEVMITGLAILGGASETVTDSEGNEKHLAKIWDYSGCPYPEGLITTNEAFAFNHDQIEKICYMGYETEASELVSKVAKEQVAKIQSEFDI